MFMRPFVEYWRDGEDGAPCDDETGEALGAGYYGRLSAPGYLDCTDWSGPFDTALEAADVLADLYRDDSGDEADEDDEAEEWELLLAACALHDKLDKEAKST